MAKLAVIAVGGNSLIKDPKHVTVEAQQEALRETAHHIADIIEAVEGPIALTSCVAEGRHDCSLEGSCKVQPHWGVVNGAVRGALANISLASLATAPKSLPPQPLPAMAGDEIRL